MLKKYLRIFTYFLISLLPFFSTNTCAKDATRKYFKHIAYVEEGVGRPLVLIHAFPTDQRLWFVQRVILKKYFHLIILDLSGFGASSETDGQAVTMVEYATEVKQLLNQLHISKAIIGGESMGGYVALAFLQQYPEMTDGLILSDTQSIADTEEAKQKRELMAQTVLIQGTSGLINDLMPKLLSPNASPELRQSLRTILESQTPTGIASALRGMALREDLSQTLTRTNLPILILTGDKDTLISPEQSQNMHALAKNSKLVTLTNAGHLSNLEQPDQWNNAVINMFYQS